MHRLTRLLCLVAFLLAGCASPTDPTLYARETPVFDLRQYFSGTVDGWGIVQDRRGRVIKRFTVEIACRWEGDTGTLDESFVYSDGTRQRRIWTVRQHADGRYTGTADDVVGEAAGRAAGNALYWTYTLTVPVDDTSYDIRFDDWMFLVDSDVLLNRAKMSKFGFTVGEVTLSFRRRGS